MGRYPNNTSYQEVSALYKALRPDYQLRNWEDILAIHNFDIRKTKGYSDLTQEQKDLFESYVCEHMNGVGLNTKITMFPVSVHFVREYAYCEKEVWDEEDGRSYRMQIGREWVILKPDGKTKKFKKYIDDDKTEADVTSVRVVGDYLRVDWRMNKSPVWFHVMAPNNYY